MSTASYSCVVGEQLKGHHFKDRGQELPDRGASEWRFDHGHLLSDRTLVLRVYRAGGVSAWA